MPRVLTVRLQGQSATSKVAGIGLWWIRGQLKLLVEIFCGPLAVQLLVKADYLLF
jgi:hypothetical protein